jgi:hypothetical protein
MEVLATAGMLTTPRRQGPGATGGATGGVALTSPPTAGGGSGAGDSSTAGARLYHGGMEEHMRLPLSSSSSSSRAHATHGHNHNHNHSHSHRRQEEDNSSGEGDIDAGVDLPIFAPPGRGHVGSLHDVFAAVADEDEAAAAAAAGINPTGSPLPGIMEEEIGSPLNTMPRKIKKQLQFHSPVYEDER